MPICLLHTTIDSPEQALRVLEHKLPSGFSTPAEDYLENLPNLNKLLIKHPAATIIGLASGEAMTGHGIMDGSFVVIDRSIEPANNATIVTSIAGKLSIQILDKANRLLRPTNKKQRPIPLPANLHTFCKGTITYTITPERGFAFPC